MKRFSRQRREDMARESLSRAVNGITMSNYPDIFRGFMACGIPEADIRPRENVFTYHAWRALGRQVRKGEHGVKVHTWIDATKETTADGVTKEQAYRFCRTVTVFHVSQTDPIEAREPVAAA
jgi:hypothetical protein